MSYDISVVQNAQGYFNTSLQTFDLFGVGDSEKNTKQKIKSEEKTGDILNLGCIKTS